ncbi:hypothetical protein GCM10007108_10440 [Thermogymnomonas acidicola]|uniref:Uncharacterized protein n=1 Tax=Thermogymnomonas acidicola TaxID=399579 RepID=A0AA37BRF0_9ARCH|nr:hypothetical protein GCM10007108_10440 [Thermogymnomonas acidicola]
MCPGPWLKAAVRGVWLPARTMPAAFVQQAMVHSLDCRFRLQGFAGSWIHGPMDGWGRGFAWKQHMGMRSG